MTRPEPARLRRRSSAVPATIAAIAAIAAGSGAPLAASTSAVDASPIRAWVDRYYADYTAMSADPTGPAMDRWLAHYAPYAFFEDPTLGVSGIGHDQIRAPYVEGFTGPLGPVRWTLLRRVTAGEWTAVEGWLDGTQNGVPLHVRFTTWLKLRRGKIVHQIDYVDYAAMRRQVAGEETISRQGLESAAKPGRGGRRADRALRLSGEFYRRYEEMSEEASPAALARHLELLTAEFELEDPTGRLAYDSRATVQAALREALAKGDFGAFHWEIDRRVTDGEWIAVEGSFRGLYKGRPFSTRFTTWLQVRGARIARQIDYLDYTTFRRQTAPPKVP